MDAVIPTREKRDEDRAEDEDQDEDPALTGKDQDDILSKMDAELAAQESGSGEHDPAAAVAVVTSGESFDSADGGAGAGVGSDDDSSVLPPPSDGEESSISNHPRDDDTYGFSLQGSQPPDQGQGPAAQRPAEPAKSEAVGPEQEPEIAVASMDRPSSPARGTSGSHNSNSNSNSNRSDATNPKFKTKIDSRLTNALKAVDLAEQRRSPDLVPLTRNYQVFRKQLRKLIVSIKAYKKTTEKMEEARSKLYAEYFTMSKDTPLYDHVGKSLESERLQLMHTGDVVVLPGMNDGLDASNSEQQLEENLGGALSLASVHQLALMSEKKGSDEYEKYILAYALEWEEIVTSRLDKEIKTVQQLQRRRLHYERKVAGLRKRTNNMEAKGKEKPQLAEKLLRNEQKLADAFQSHEQRAAELCVLLEEATQNGWKDLYPLLKNSIRFEINRLKRDEASYGRLTSTLDAMKKRSFSPSTSPTTSEVGA